MKFDQEPQINTLEERGIKGEKLIENFERRAFSSLVTSIEKTNQFDNDDSNGIDFIWSVKTKKGIEKLAVDVTDPDDMRKKSKIKRLTLMPCVRLHDGNNNPTTDPMPRVLINYRLGYFLMLGEKAQQSGTEVYDQMTEKERKEQKKDQLNQILNQMTILSRNDSDYMKRVKFIKQAFEREQENLT